MKQGEIYFVDLEPTMGHEQRGMRPVLVISPDVLHLRTNAQIVLPITTGGAFAARLGLAVMLPANMRTTGLVRCDQPRTIDLSARGGRYVERVPAATLHQVLDRFLSIFDPEAEAI